MILRTLIFLSVLFPSLAISTSCQHFSKDHSLTDLATVDYDGFTDGANFRYTELGFVSIFVGKTDIAEQRRPAIVFADQRGNYYALISGRLTERMRQELKKRLPEDENWTLTEGSVCPHPIYRPSVSYPAICIGFSVTGSSTDQWLAGRQYCDRLGIKPLNREFTKW